jgi:surface carbohydrate biosynthesis protein
MNKREIYLPMEIYSREYLGKLALTLEFLKRNLIVYLGANHAIRAIAMGAVAGGIFFETKGMTPSGMNHLASLKNSGLILVGQDEEAGISFKSFESFAKFRPEIHGLEIFDKFFTWGQDDQMYISSLTPGANLVRTGSAKSLFWGSFGEKFYADEAQILQENIGDYVLIISNLSMKNKLISKKQMNRYLYKSGYKKDEYDFTKREIWEELAFKKIIEIVETISKKTSFKVVLRPHPSEDVEPWNKLFQHNANVKVSKKGNIVATILGARHVLHAGSTAGLESLLLGKSTLSYQNLVGFEDEEMFANTYSQSLNSLEDLVMKLNSGDSFPPLPGFLEIARRKLSCFGEYGVIENQVSEILEIVERTSNSNLIEMGGDLKKTGTLKRVIERIRFGKSNFEKLSSNKRPQISSSDLEFDLKKLQKLLSYEFHVEIHQLADSTFRIERI